MYTIKQTPEDFFVKEISNVKVDETGDYSYFVLKKKNYTTLRAAQQIARILGVRLKDLGFAGSKDKNAVTEQLVSVKNIGKERLDKIELKDISIEFLGKGDKPISLGDLEGNYFKIVVRDCENFPKEMDKFRNLFGEQRFSRNNEEVGKAIIKKDFKKAVELVMETDNDEKSTMEEHLKRMENDYVGALKRIPIKKLKMYVHAYQSFLWNKMANESEEEEIPIIGFGTDDAEEILEPEGIKTRDFIIRSIPELSAEGSERKVFSSVKELKIKKIDEKTFELEFILPRGCYATELVKQMFTQ